MFQFLLQHFTDNLAQACLKSAASQPSFGLTNHSSRTQKANVVKGVKFIGFESADIDEAVSSLRKELKKLILEDDWSTSPQKRWIPQLNARQVRS